MLHLLWTVVIGFIAGLIARMILPGNNPSGFIMTTLLGIAGAIVAKYLGEALHWYRPGQPAGFIASILSLIHI